MCKGKGLIFPSQFLNGGVIMRLVFEHDLDTLEELPINIKDGAFVEVYSASNDFALSIYGVKANGSKELIESVPSEIEHGLVLKFDKTNAGNIFVEHTIHGNEANGLEPVDTIYITNDYHKLILVSNDEVTVKYYER